MAKYNYGPTALFDAVRIVSKAAFQIVVVLLQGSAPVQAMGADLVIVDTLGHAASAYPPATNGFPVIIVRPDGVVGSVVGGVEGVNKYLKTIFVQ